MSNRATYKLRLYVAGDAPNSVLAEANLRALCQTHLNGRHEIEIVDVTRHPKRALEDAVLLTPTLVRLAPGPELKLIGNLTQTPTVLRMFNLPAVS